MMKQQEKQWIQQPIYTVNGQKMTKLYKKIKMVGEGSYSKCWLVKTQNSGSQYVVKIIPKKKLELLVKEKLVYEIRIHQQLSHPNVVHLDHWFQDENYQHIFMEYCSEGNLEKRLQRGAQMPEKDIKYYVRQIVQAIIYIHSKNILHRDLKLCNFYIDADNNIKLGDFGFACQLSHHGELKRQTCGTPNYIAPEAVSGFGYSFSSDIWAIGVILYRLKFKICPFQGRSVRQTLEKVKLCQFTYPKGVKISNQLKDLIEQIFVINYDERLTLNQILAHPFFESESSKAIARPKSESKGGFSMLKSIFSKQKQPKQVQRRSSRLKEEKKEQVAKRSNSCETFKQIKEIFKNKSKNTLVTQQNTQDMKTEQTITMNYMTRVDTLREKSVMTGNTMRSIAETTLGINAINKRLQGTARTNNFICNVKEQLKMNTKVQILQKQPQSSGTQQLSMLAKKYYLPQQIHFQKDVIVISYKSSIMQLIYHGNGYILHRKKNAIYQMNGSPFLNPPKLVKFIIENRIQIAQSEPDQQQYGQNTLQKILLFVSHRWYSVKDGIILRFGPLGTFVAKMMNQQMFYIGSATLENDSLKQDGKLSLMYTKQGPSYKCAEGIVLSRIYQGWIANVLKQSQGKQ